jgi:hypothetical protein
MFRVLAEEGYHLDEFAFRFDRRSAAVPTVESQTKTVTIGQHHKAPDQPTPRLTGDSVQSRDQCCGLGGSRCVPAADPFFFSRITKASTVATP